MYNGHSFQVIHALLGLTKVTSHRNAAVVLSRGKKGVLCEGSKGLTGREKENKTLFSAVPDSARV